MGNILLFGTEIYHEKADLSINRVSYSSGHLPGGVYIVKVKLLMV